MNPMFNNRVFVSSASLFLFIMMVSTLHFSCSGRYSRSLKGSDLFGYFDEQARKTQRETMTTNSFPVVINQGSEQWTTNDISNWRSGFWPGIEWYLYESTKDDFWKREAEKSTGILEKLLDKPVATHDLGFQFYCSFGNGYRLSGDPYYKRVLLRAADSLAKLYNPVVGTILSWPGRYNASGTSHNTIIDNMMNLELLFWASKNGGDKKLYDIAATHAAVTMKNHFRPDYSVYHVVLYDVRTGEKIKGFTHQGYADNSTWARGQAWAIYGYTMVYRETGNKEFLQTAVRAADVYLRRLPHDHIPFWDFDDPAIPEAPRDASAASIVASALLELSSLVEENALRIKYTKAATDMLRELSTDKYLSKGINHAFLLHSTGNKPSGKDVDVPIIYADYYFLEALLRLQKRN